MIPSSLKSWKDLKDAAAFKVFPWLVTLRFLEAELTLFGALYLAKGKRIKPQKLHSALWLLKLFILFFKLFYFLKTKLKITVLEKTAVSAFHLCTYVHNLQII